MKSRISKDFRKALRNLPPDVQRAAYEAYRVFKINPYHPSLQFKKVKENPLTFSVRISIKYRALGIMMSDDEILWYFIGSHGPYDKELKR
ncbi:MAG: hypothetical protein SF029_01545 [bacterium]|nr:hypothetical protein [bacterium]